MWSILGQTKREAALILDEVVVNPYYTCTRRASREAETEQERKQESRRAEYDSEGCATGIPGSSLIEIVNNRQRRRRSTPLSPSWPVLSGNPGRKRQRNKVALEAQPTLLEYLGWIGRTTCDENKVLPNHLILDEMAPASQRAEQRCRFTAELGLDPDWGMHIISSVNWPTLTGCPTGRVDRTRDPVCKGPVFVLPRLQRPCRLQLTGLDNEASCHSIYMHNQHQLMLVNHIHT